MKKTEIKAALMLLFVAGGIFGLYCFAFSLLALNADPPARLALGAAGIQLIFFYTLLSVIAYQEK